METDSVAAFYWEQVALEIISFGKKTIKKGFLNQAIPEISKSGLFYRSIALNKGQILDWRAKVESTGRSVHILEYTDKFVGHIDTFDPADRPAEHLIFDGGKDMLKSAAELYLKRKIKKKF